MLKKYQLKVKSFSVCYGNRFNIFLFWNSGFLFSSDIFLNICICFISCHTSNVRGGFRILSNIYGEASIGLTTSVPPEKARKPKVFWRFQGVKTLLTIFAEKLYHICLTGSLIRLWTRTKYFIYSLEFSDKLLVHLQLFPIHQYASQIPDAIMKGSPLFSMPQNAAVPVSLSSNISSNNWCSNNLEELQISENNPSGLAYFWVKAITSLSGVWQIYLTVF